MKKVKKNSGKRQKVENHIVKSAGGSMDKGGKPPKSFKHYNPDTIPE